jgi:DNA processing protein
MTKAKLSEQEKIHLAAWAQLQIPITWIKKYKKIFGSYQSAWNADLSQSGLEPSDEVKETILKGRRKTDPEKNWQSLIDHNYHFLTQSSDHYPPLLKEISSAPLFLFARGNLSAFNKLNKLAVVGTRKITEYGKRVLNKMIPEWVSNGLTIVSGLAYGVDAYAHELTLKSNGTAIAVLGNGIDKFYPADNDFLARRILLSNGLIISEYAPKSPAFPMNFPARNRIVAGLCKASIIIEAQQKSGSLITADFALNQNRDVYAVPGDIFAEFSSGTNHLVQQGAVPLIEPLQVLESYNITGKEKEERVLTFKTDQERNIYNQLSSTLHIDDLARQLSLSPTELSQELTMLEMRGIVKNLGGMRYCRN